MIKCPSERETRDIAVRMKVYYGNQGLYQSVIKDFLKTLIKNIKSYVEEQMRAKHEEAEIDTCSDDFLKHIPR